MKNNLISGAQHRSISALLSAFILSFGISFAIPTFAANPGSDSTELTPIKFTRGAISTQIRGRFTRDHAPTYVVNASAGDRMIVNVISLTPNFATAGGVTSPSGKTDGSHGGIVFNQTLTESGAYKVTPGVNQMATNVQGGNYIIEIVILPSYLK